MIKSDDRVLVQDPPSSWSVACRVANINRINHQLNSKFKYNIMGTDLDAPTQLRTMTFVLDLAPAEPFSHSQILLASVETM